jgi:hypothetical protein
MAHTAGVQAELEFRAGEPPVVGVPAAAGSSDALVDAVLQVPNDARAVFARHGTLDRLDALMRHPSAAGWSPLQHLGHVVDTLHRTAMWTVAAFDEGRAYGVPPDLAARPDANLAPPRAVLGALDQASTDLADALTRIPPDAWITPLGNRADTITIFAVVDRTIGDVQHHLAEIDALLASRSDKRP